MNQDQDDPHDQSSEAGRDAPQANAGQSVLLICDTNVVIMMVLFKPSVMFDAAYSFGRVAIHQSVIDELSRWISVKNAKWRKFGEDRIQEAISRCTACVGAIAELPHEQWAKNRHFLGKIEEKLSLQDKGTATSDVDKRLLALASKNRANLATQERTLRSLATRTLGDGRVFSMEDMIDDLLRQGLLSKDDVEAGLASLDYYKESLRAEARRRLDEKIRSGAE